jgi:photosystem II stability/assembly factor-like uncharacterized protein
MKKAFFTFLLFSFSFLGFSQWNILPDHIQGLNYAHNLNDVIMTSNGIGFRRIVTPNSNTQYLYKTTNDWQTETLNSPLSYTKNKLDFINDNVGVKVSSINGIDSVYKTIDGGNSWTNWFTSTNISHIQLLNDSTLFYAYSNTLNGLSVNRIMNQQHKVIYSAYDSITFLSGNGIHFLDSNLGYILTVNPSQSVAPNILKRTMNAGNTWHDVFPQSGTLVSCLKFQNLVIGYFGTNNGSIYKTTDYGVSWRLIQTPLSSNINDIEFGQNNSVYVASQNGMLIKTNDNGTTWNIEQVGTNKNLIDIHTIENSNTVYVNTVDGDIFKNDFLTDIQSINPPKNQISIFPNPTNELINVQSSELINSISLYDVNGKFILETQQSQIDVSRLSTGIYFLSIKSNSSHAFLKFVKE